MLRCNVNRILPAIIAGIAALAACSSMQAQTRINLSPTDDGRHFEVEYRSARPTEAITLARTPDATRKTRWRTASPDFEIVQLEGKDVIRRIDGALFSSVEIVVPATYVPLRKDYAPFSPFSDGGLLIHSGRFQACPSSGENSVDDCDGPWLMQIHAPQNAHLLLNGDIYDDFARWSDSNDGTKIYVGQAMPRSTVNFVGIVDSALPPAISGLMSASLPELMRFYGQHLPELAQRPMLFVSYDPDYEHGHGRQGGTLPNQVFMHFYGPTWQETDMDGDTPQDIGWFFAHEAGHIFQHGVAGDRESSWIHEGAAEAFAYLALEELEVVSDAYLDSRRQQALEGCRDALGKGTLATAAERGSISDYYHCGLIMFIAIDNKIRMNSSNQRNLFDLWTALIPEFNGPDLWDTSTFLRKAEPWIGRDLASQLLSMSIEEQVSPEDTLARLGK